jgi:hypothetical protein
MSWEDREWARWTPSERERFFGRVVGPRSSTDASRVVGAMLVAAAITIAAWVPGPGRPIPFVGRSTRRNRCSPLPPPVSGSCARSKRSIHEPAS